MYIQSIKKGFIRTTLCPYSTLRGEFKTCTKTIENRSPIIYISTYCRIKMYSNDQSCHIRMVLLFDFAPVH